MTKLLTYVCVLAALVGLVLVVDLSQRSPSGAIASAANDYMRCAAYYQVTADTLENDGDKEVSDQYRDRASIVFNAGALLADRPIFEMQKEQNRFLTAFAASLSSADRNLGDLASRYDDQCMVLLDN